MHESQDLSRRGLLDRSEGARPDTPPPTPASVPPSTPIPSQVTEPQAAERGRCAYRSGIAGNSGSCGSSNIPGLHEPAQTPQATGTPASPAESSSTMMKTMGQTTLSGPVILKPPPPQPNRIISSGTVSKPTSTETTTPVRRSATASATARRTPPKSWRCWGTTEVRVRPVVRQWRSVRRLEGRDWPGACGPGLSTIWLFDYFSPRKGVQGG